MGAIEEFVSNTPQFAGYTVNKTLSVGLRPVGKTRENIEQYKLLEKDKERAKAFLRVKKYLTKVHGIYIGDRLTAYSFEPEEVKNLWNLYDAWKHAEKKDRKAAKKEYEKAQEDARKKIAKFLTADTMYSKLFKAEVLTDVLPGYFSGVQETADIKLFIGFFTYFGNYNIAKRKMYDYNNKGTVSYRVVNDNITLFFDNQNILSAIKNYPELYKENAFQKLEKIYADTFKASSAFIGEYNLCISGVFDEEGNNIEKGVNQLINEYCALNKGVRIAYLKPLYKNILSEKKPLFTVDVFETTEEVTDEVKTFEESIEKPYSKFVSYINSDSYSYSGIYIAKKNLNTFSHFISGDPFIVEYAVKDKYKKEYGERDCFSIAEIIESVKEYNEINEKTADCNFERYFNVVKTFKPELYFSKIPFEKITDLQFDKTQAVELKEYLQTLLDHYNTVRMVKVYSQDDDNYKPDEKFYFELDTLIDAYKPIVKLYNKIRNFVTKKLSSEKSIKMNFDCPQLLDGWDYAVEKTKNGMMFYDSENDVYYLGIYNAKTKKPDFEICEDSKFKKMYLKMIPEPYKMLPHVCFSQKGIETFKPSEEILEGYKKGLHKKGSDFDINFCHKLIDFYKDCIAKREEWNVFNFKFSPTETYADTSAFFEELSKDAYNVELHGIDRAKLDAAVEEGSVYLFELYNKHLDKKAHGKNLYTQIIRSLFDKNCNNIQLCAGAEIFWRPALIKKNITHPKGSVIVNKVSKEGFTIENEVWFNIYKYLNHFTDHLTPEAKTLLDSGSVVYKNADRDLIKDRRYTEENFSLHFPVKINQKAGDMFAYEFNKKVLETVRNDKTVNILSINRGENNLIYAVLMNRNGEVIFDKSFNLIESGKQNVNYKNKLVVKSKERNAARTNWQEIDGIKDLKKGYLSCVVAEIARLIVKNNAILVMESLDTTFKSSRQYIESNVYQQFEAAILDKLSCLILKENDADSAGGLYHPYQLVPKFQSFEKIFLQWGFVFFINSAYISKIDPANGIANIFNFAELTNNEKRINFFKKMDSIKIENNHINFEYNLEGDFKGKQTVSAIGERNVWNPKEKTFERISLEKIAEELSDKNGNATDLLSYIKNEKPLPAFTEKLLKAFIATVSFKTFTLDEWTYVSPDNKTNQFTGKSMDYIGAYNLGNKFRIMLERDNGDGFLNNIKASEYFAELLNIIQKN